MGLHKLLSKHIQSKKSLKRFKFFLSHHFQSCKPPSPPVPIALEFLMMKASSKLFITSFEKEADLDTVLKPMHSSLQFKLELRI